MKDLRPLALLVALAACGKEAPPGARAVAELPGRTLTVADLDAYLQANLPTGSDAEAEAGTDTETTSAELDQVKSRLFDDFLDEETLLLEAERQNVVVSDEEIDAYLGREGEEEEAVGGPPPEVRRKMARRDLAIQRVRETWVRSRASVTPDEIDRFLMQNRSQPSTEKHLVLRSVRVSSAEEAGKLRDELIRKRLTFDEMVAAAGGSGQGEPIEVALASLPVTVQAAVADLKPGGISAPVEVQGATYLFLVEAWRSKVEDEETLRRRARETLLRSKYEDASRALLRQLREKSPPRIHPENLPFHYVADAGAAANP